MDTDLTALSDEDFAELRAALVAEIDRREALARIPQQIVEQAQQFYAIGGDPAALTLPDPVVATPSEDVEPVEPPVDGLDAGEDGDVVVP